MKKIIAILTLVVMMLSMCTVVSFAQDTGMILYVSTTGNDANDGSEASPLATLKGARDKIRAIKQSSGLPQNGITVVFRGGQYKWTETVEFTEADSGTQNAVINYRSYPGEKVFFEGGVKVPGTQFTPVTDEDVLVNWTNAKVKEAIRQIDIKSVMSKQGYKDLYDYYPLKYSRYSFGGNYSHLIESEKQTNEDPSAAIRRPIYSFEGEQALWIARYPNKSGGAYPDVNPYTQFLQTGEVIKDGGTTEPSVFKYSDRRISKYSGRDDVWFYGFPYYLFYHTDQKIIINSSDSTITSATPMDLGMKSGRDYFIYNIIEELDAPGEYFVDKNTGIMYVYPTGDITKTNLNVAVFDKDWMIKTYKTSFVTFSGITFENSKGGALYIEKGDSVRIEHCNFYNFGTEAIEIGKRVSEMYTVFGQPGWSDQASQFSPFTAEAQPSWNYAERQAAYYLQDKYSVNEMGKNHSVYGCHIKNVGQTAITVGGGNIYRDERAGFVIENNRIEFPGVYKRTYTGGIYLDNVHGITVKNNFIGHAPATALNGNTTAADIIGNEFADNMMESFDMGVIYLNYGYLQFDLKINGNYFHDTPSEYKEPSTATSAGSQRSGIALDNTYGGGYEMKNNQFVNIPRGSFVYANELIENNVWVDCHMAIQSTATNYWYPIADETFRGLGDYASIEAGYFAQTPGWAFNASGENGKKVVDTWTKNYPTVSNWYNIVRSQAHGGKTFMSAKNNLVVNKSIPLSTSAFNFNSVDFYKGEEVMNKEVSNNNYNSDTSIFEDYANKNYQITAEGAAKYGITPLNLKLVGPQITTGVEGYTAALPTAVSGGTVQTPSAVPEIVKDAVVLKIGASDALANGKAVKVDSNNANVMPKIINSRTLVPARFIAESFGGEVGWDDATRTVTIKLNGKTVTMVLDKNELMIDGVVATVMDVPAQSIEGRTMVPLRALCETALSKKVFWDPKGLIVVSDTDNILDSTKDASIIDSILNMLK